MGRKLRIAGNILRGTANLTARGIANASEFYWRNKEYIDPVIMVTGGAVIGSSLLDNNLSPLEAIAISGVGAGTLAVAEEISNQINSPKGTIGSYTAALSLSTILSSGYLAKFGAHHTDASVLSQIGNNLFDVSCLIVGGYALMKLAKGVYSLNNNSEDTIVSNPERRDFLRKSASTIATAAVGGYALKTINAFDKLTNLFTHKNYSGDEIKFVKKNGMKMVGVHALQGDNYESIANDFLSDVNKKAELEKINGKVKAGKPLYVPTSWLKFSLESIDDVFVDNLNPARPSLWSMSEYWAVPKTENNRKDKIMGNVRIMQRLSNIQDVTKISDEKPIYIPTNIVHDKKMLAELISSDNQENKSYAENSANLTFDTTHLNKIPVPRNRFVGIKNGRRTYETALTSIDMLVIHTTETPNFSKDANVVSGIARKRSANFVIGRDGTIYYTVPMEYVANHAGESIWNGVDDLNYNSIGVELIACRDKKHCLPITKNQYNSLRKLKDYLKSTYHLSDDKILGHNQVACSYKYNQRGRKGDPGIGFEWEKIGINKNHYDLIDPDNLSGSLEGISPQARYEDGNKLPGAVNAREIYKRSHKGG